MKNPTIGALTALILIPSASANTLLWSDNFNVADTTNFDGAPLTGRLTGTLAPAVFARSAKAQQTIAGNQVKMTVPAGASGRLRFQNSGGWYDWAAGAGAPDILADGGMRVEFDFTPSDATSANWVSFVVGFLGSAAGEPPTRVNNAETDYGILFRNNGQTQRFDNGPAIGAGGAIVPVLTPRHIVLDYAFDSFADGTQVKVRVSENGVQVANDNFTWANNANALYMELETNQANSLIDNYTVSSIPVIYSLSLDGNSVISGESPGAAIGYFLSETFAKGPESSTFAFVAGDGDADNSKFQISGDTLQNGSYDFKQDPDGTTYSIRVLGTGDASGGTQEKTIQLTLSKDDDFDGIDDTWELGFANNLTDLDGLANGPGPGAGTGDFDGDGLTDFEEYDYSLNEYPDISPILADTDADGLSDFEELNPTLPRPLTNPTMGDTDKDGLSDMAESNSGTFANAGDTGTDATLVDTDGDGARDGFEVERGSDPTDFASRPALPAGFELVQVTDDTSTGLDPINTYSHKISGGGVATVNGVALDLLSTTVTPADFTWIPSGIRAMVAPVNNRTWVPADGGVTGAGLQQMFGGFTYNTIGDPAGVQTYTLGNLRVGTTYHLKMFIRPWETAGTSRRPIDLVFTNGSTVEQPFGALLLDRPGVVLNNGNDNSAYYVSYIYQAESTELVITAGRLAGGS